MSALNLQAVNSEVTRDTETAFRSELIEAQERIAQLQAECDELNAMKQANAQGQDDSADIVMEPDDDNVHKKVQ